MEKMKMSVSLYALAEQNCLPNFQYLDASTCDWIAANNPRYTIDAAALPRADREVLSLEINATWFLRSELINSLHGIRHARRVAYYSYVLAVAEGLDVATAKTVSMAALLHDIRRLDDRGDSSHAERASQWLVDNASEIEDSWGMHFTSHNLQLMSNVIALHETPYSDFSKAQTEIYEHYAQAVDILKTADALDRYRLPKCKWWIQDEFLHLVPPDWLKQQAYEIILKSERHCLQSGEVDCVVTILEEGM